MAGATPELPRPRIIADRGCPFSHRVVSLLHHLRVEYDCHEAPLGELPPETARWSPSGRIPLLVHGELVIGGSHVMLDYLAEAYDFDAAYPRELIPRTLQRHAMVLMDEQLAPTLTDGRMLPQPLRILECLDLLEAAVLDSPPVPSLLAFHLAPVWLRLRWWHPDGAITGAIESRPALSSWLDGAAGLDAVASTAPTRAQNVADYQAALAKRRVAHT